MTCGRVGTYLGQVLSVASRVKRLCEIYTLPLSLGWAADIDPNGDTAYHYWKRLELLTEVEFNAILKNRKVTPNALLERFFANMDIHFPPARYNREEVADVGSGYGFMTFWALLSGAAVVHTIGDPERIGFINRLYDAAVGRGLVAANGLRSRQEFFGISDTSLSPTVVPGTLGLVLLTDTLEHITPRLLPSLTRAAFNDLKEGGLFISRQLNTSSPLTMRRLKPVWTWIEKEIMLPQRVGIIGERFPDIDRSKVEELARRTRGLDRPDFHAALDRFAADGTLPSHDLDIAPVDVVLDVPAEGDTDIQRILEAFRTAGFSHRCVYPDVTTSRRSRFLHPLAKRLPGWFLSAHVLDSATVFVMRK